MKKEIEYAVDNFHRIAFGTKKNGNKHISESKLASFITILTDLLFKRYENNWYPENPDRGSGFRCIRVNTQSIDPTIKESMKRASIVLPGELLATEVTIWVDPGVVSVRIGEDGSIGSEIVDEEVYNMKKPQSCDSPIKRSGSVDDEEFSSRSSSPDSRSSVRSESASPPLQPFSTTPRFVSPSPVHPVMEYNPYSPPSRVSYPQRYRQNPSPPSSHSSSPHSLKNTLSSPARAFHSMAAATQARSPLSSRGSPISFSSHGDFGQAGQSHIPGSTHQRTMTYTRPRAIFPATSESNSHMEGLGKIGFNPYSLPFGYDRHMPTANFYDIPAMA
ncbi:maternal B9.10 protein [Aplysia californica]|uniref:Maternal B9.10 protein n=1 Tax=Aplysia californica TaxID=6500 RepID=A0ABM0K9I6_APLCA|nr:maternal B9.10 protein [Aplysia californica]